MSLKILSEASKMLQNSCKLAIDYKEPLKHFKEYFQKQAWKMYDLSIESWVQYVTAGNPLPLCKLWNPKCMEIFDVFSKRKYGPN